ncbi:hypothetical protein K438DRAFT_1752659 [Mycena galopus ATCC 62051]|nr:hypothetical protein K438DRAFT_1752659 [Mycena galopus ATCC 62051]
MQPLRATQPVYGGKNVPPDWLAITASCGTSPSLWCASKGSLTGKTIHRALRAATCRPRGPPKCFQIMMRRGMPKWHRLPIPTESACIAIVARCPKLFGLAPGTAGLDTKGWTYRGSQKWLLNVTMYCGFGGRQCIADGGAREEERGSHRDADFNDLSKTSCVGFAESRVVSVESQHKCVGFCEISPLCVGFSTVCRISCRVSELQGTARWDQLSPGRIKHHAWPKALYRIQRGTSIGGIKMFGVVDIDTRSEGHGIT